MIYQRIACGLLLLSGIIGIIISLLTSRNEWDEYKEKEREWMRRSLKKNNRRI